MDRRLFLINTSKYALTGLILPDFFSESIKVSKEAMAAIKENTITTDLDAREKEYIIEEHHHAYVIDTTKCIGCGSCVRACSKENDVPEDFYRTWIERYVMSTSGEAHIDSPKGGMNGFVKRPIEFKVAKAFFVPKLCNHCNASPCVQVCPVGASYFAGNGAVLVDQEHCIGCGYCVQACPYASRFINPKTHVADKCTWCFHRITKNLKPACVDICPVEARLFGNLKNEDDPVRKIITTERVGVLQPTILTKPNCYYIGLDQEVR